MNVAVTNEAKEGLKFAQYVDYLIEKNLVPMKAEPLLKHIKDKGNEANHQIKIIEKEEAEQLMRFTEMFLEDVFGYEALFKPEEDIESDSQE